MKAGRKQISSILSDFRRDEGGNFAIMGAIVVAPLLLFGMAAIDASNLMRTRTNVQNALDAAALAVGRQFGGGAPEGVMQEYGQKYFSANLRAIDPAKVEFKIVPPGETRGGRQLSATADFPYESLFGTLARSLTGDDWTFQNHMVSDVRVRNTVEVALVLDNSGSMDERGTGSNKKRMELLRTAATQLVENMAGQAEAMVRVEKAVQFSVVPFAASVNVGSDYRNAVWMDSKGLSSVHFENFDISKTISIRAGQDLVPRNGQLFMEGNGWPAAKRNQPFSRFHLFDQVGEGWLGCVEARPGSLNLDDTKPDVANPDTLFVPMFAPDEYDGGRARNNWWPDEQVNRGERDPGAVARQRSLKKYFTASSVRGEGPNYSCTTSPITPLTDVSTDTGLRTIRNAISGMVPNGATNVPEGMAWGWRTISHGEPFTQGRPDDQEDNDKVVIVLTDGANTYYTRSYFGADDQAGSISDYSAFGYAGQRARGHDRTRIFENTSQVDTGVHTLDNYTAAMNEQFAKLCNNVRNADVIVMTVALDLDASKGTAADRRKVQAQIDALTACASESRSRRDPNDPSKPARLFWNTTGGDLAETFRQIGDELSNLRIVK
ncbi:TadE/TadG family type IV pilus assembly protein [Brucella sp. IR073]|uniref:TadE/TadG family type IV pilus assembly protein n=1 Tax=unclassified Brucella TaxID=2632610 RepID=UPI003B986570